MQSESSIPRQTPVAAYLEILELAPVTVGCRAYVQGKRSATGTMWWKVVAINGQTATLRRRKELPPNWQEATDTESKFSYYHNTKTNLVQWEYPELPAPWEAITDEKTGRCYYHNTATNKTEWAPPCFEDLERPLRDLRVEEGPSPSAASNSGLLPPRAAASEVTITVWRRSFLDDPQFLHAMSTAVTKLMCQK